MSSPASPPPGSAGDPISNPNPSVPLPGQMGQPPAPVAPQLGNQPAPGYPQHPGGGGYGNYTNQAYLRPKPGIIPIGPLNIGDIFSGAVNAIRTNPVVMFVVPLGIIVCVSLIGLIIEAGGAGLLANNSGTLISSSFSQISAWLVVKLGSVLMSRTAVSIATLIASALLIFAVSDLVLGRTVTLSRVWKGTRHRILPLLAYVVLVILASILFTALMIGILYMSITALISAEDQETAIGLSVLLTLLFAVVAAIFYAYVSTKLLFVGPVIILEELGPFRAIARSWKLTRNQFWRVFGVTLLAGLIAGAIVGMLSIPINVAFGISALDLNEDIFVIRWTELTANFLQNVLTAVVLPFTAGVSALLYIDVRIRKENLAQTLISSLR